MYQHQAGSISKVASREQQALAHGARLGADRAYLQAMYRRRYQVPARILDNTLPKS